MLLAILIRKFVMAAALGCSLMACSPVETAPSRITSNEPVLAPACFSKPEAGRCRAAIRRFYFDEKSGQCQVFLWGGCEGSVPFKTLAQCQSSCKL